jgi:hypothetical protein
MRRGGMRVEELHFTNSKTEESNSMKNGSGVSITPNTSGSMSSPANGQEDLDEHLLPSYYFDDCSPNALSDIVSVDQSISTNTWPYQVRKGSAKTMYAIYYHSSSHPSFVKVPYF